MSSNSEDILSVSEVVLFGSHKAYRRLVDKYQSPVRRFFLLHTDYNRELSDDLSQETFIRCWEKIATFRGISSFSTWLYTIAYHILSDHFRRQKECCTLQDEYPDKIYESSDDTERKHDIQKALRVLSHDERVCATLFYLDDMTIAKITKITGMPSGTIKSHLSRARVKLGDFLKDQGYETGHHK